ncbi:uroporphyrinogen-III C-methyltransferase [Aeromonas taiwanensis]|uniref:uroporphyrinogen-III C-methyltransferase n=1 Tax=Aeromonas taiwanensis TaxID=633417 RepID=A0A5F0K9D8_9GAMM|nr:uroporphyrinogen-III C-methyltransferase [Aeromonas taiwanensis]TFF74335.1 uroporphyrinogen-III C-methyltransferase [Aeromonas taiwanensis]TFF75098.1 uroporphyrinogen-III C-methyltransferase [Aeromonas taiwanensis]TFF78552.1 uroporphyrinogen-III C-methyltransferase [Aeromonas taiwanensis]
MSQISLVGAGPGPLELLTLRALQRLEAAEVVVYDRLVGSEILARIPRGAARFDVGKRCGEPSPTQEEINALLLALARTGKRVVRLKGGDPLVFGRGGEEALHLARHGIEAELVPGITAALGCAASTFIPLTHRGLARSLTLVTGHQMDERDYQGWQGLTRAGHTLVFYMGLERAARIRQGLLGAGACGDLPVALVVAGCSARQQVHHTRLEALEEAASALLGQSPVLIIMGEVVRLRTELQALLNQALERVA